MSLARTYFSNRKRCIIGIYENGDFYPEIAFISGYIFPKENGAMVLVI